MSGVIQKLKGLLPATQNQQSNRRRALVWQRWDTNSFSFLKMAQIQEQLIALLDIESSPNFSYICQKAFGIVKQCTAGLSPMQGEYLEQRFFRLFIESFTKLLETMMIFESFDVDKDNRIGVSEFVGVQKVFQKMGFDGEKYNAIYLMSTKNQLTLQEFILWGDRNSIEMGKISQYL